MTNLTERQIDVLRMASEGLTTPEIAAQLGVSPRTVDTHREHALAELGARNMVHAVALGLKEGILT
jgi:DNA-binding CsgD family transcriptional regulator